MKKSRKKLFDLNRNKRSGPRHLLPLRPIREFVRKHVRHFIRQISRQGHRGNPYRGKWRHSVYLRFLHRDNIKQWRRQAFCLGRPHPPLSLLLSLPSPFPFLFLSHPSLRSRPPELQLAGLGERCKLPQRGLGRSPSRNRIWCIFA